MKAYLVLENGTVFEGTARGALRESIFTIVFNTAMAGYLEILSDPASSGRGIVMTYPIIGGYGVQTDDKESDLYSAAAFIVRELCRTPSNFRSTGALEGLLKAHDIPCIEGIDTRSVVRILRDTGTMRAAIVYDADGIGGALEKIKDYRKNDLIGTVSPQEILTEGKENSKITLACLDCGLTNSIKEPLLSRGCRIIRYPYNTPAAEILSKGFDGIVLSGGPGNPGDYLNLVKTAGKLAAAGKPVFAFGLGHQLLALSQGGKIVKLKHGHHGGNLPVKDSKTGRTVITSQNHLFSVDPENLPDGAAVVASNVNDGSVEALQYSGRPIISVQYTPAPLPGREQVECLFDKFIEMTEGYCNA